MKTLITVLIIFVAFVPACERKAEDAGAAGASKNLTAALVGSLNDQTPCPLALGRPQPTRVARCDGNEFVALPLAEALTTLYYNSLAMPGKNWRTDLDYSLYAPKRDTKALLTRGDGSTIAFGERFAVDRHEFNGELKHRSDGSIDVVLKTDQDPVALNFKKSGSHTYLLAGTKSARLERSYRAGTVKVTHDSGEQVTFPYRGTVLHAITTAKQGRYEFTYENQNLIRITDGAGVAVYSFDYQPATNLLTGIHIADSRGPRSHLGFAYDPQGRIKTLVDPYGNTTTLSYDAAALVVDSTHQPTGVFSFDSHQRLAQITTPEASTVFRYDGASTRFKEETSSTGKTVLFSYYESGDAKGLLKESRSAAGGKRERQYTADGSLLVETRQIPGNTPTMTRYERNQEGYLEKIINTPGDQLRLVRDPATKKISRVYAFTPQGEREIAAASYDDRGRATRVSANGSTITHSYDSNQRLRSTMADGVHVDVDHTVPHTTTLLFPSKSYQLTEVRDASGSLSERNATWPVLGGQRVYTEIYSLGTKPGSRRVERRDVIIPLGASAFSAQAMQAEGGTTSNECSCGACCPAPGSCGSATATPSP